jgi:uncharacterized membrane protein YhaH (DUF805 family)
MEKYYQTLGLNQGASIEEIQDAYNKLSVELDPKNNNNLNFFKIEHDKVFEAYTILIYEYNKSQSFQEVNYNTSTFKSSDNNFENSDTIDINSNESKESISDTLSNYELKDVNQNDLTNSSNSKKGMFKNLFSFEGRIRRLEYGLSIIIWYVYLVISTLISRGELILFYIFFIPSLWFLWSQAAKRCHDRDNSGWWQIIPLYGLWMLFADGDKGENSYGSSPK